MARITISEWLLRDANPAGWVRIIDNHIQTAKKLGAAGLVLADEHKKLLPYIERFVNDPQGFVEFVKQVRDELPDTAAKTDVHRVYRTIMTRILQSERRVRLLAAVEAYERNNRKLSYPERMAYLTKLERTWGLERLDYLKKVRGTQKHLPSKAVDTALDEFWQMIDARISRGEVPDA